MTSKNKFPKPTIIKLVLLLFFWTITVNDQLFNHFVHQSHGLQNFVYPILLIAAPYLFFSTVTSTIYWTYEKINETYRDVVLSLFTISVALVLGFSISPLWFLWALIVPLAILARAAGKAVLENKPLLPNKRKRLTRLNQSLIVSSLISFVCFLAGALSGR